MKPNRKDTLILVIAVVIALFGVVAAANAPKPAYAPEGAPQFSGKKKAVTKSGAAQQQNPAQVARGKYLVTIGGCHDCHTPWTMQANGQPGPDMSRALSGHPMQIPIKEPAQLTSAWGYAGAPTNTAFSGPWGVSFAANLTPDRLTGTGIWTFDIFKNTIRNGRHWGVARPLLPPMPWFNYREMTDEDLAAVFAYLRTLKPVYNEVQQPLPPAPVQSASK